MSSLASMPKKPAKKTSKKAGKSIWMKNVLTRNIVIPFRSIGGNINQNIQKKCFMNGTLTWIISFKFVLSKC